MGDINDGFGKIKRWRVGNVIRVKSLGKICILRLTLPNLPACLLLVGKACKCRLALRLVKPKVRSDPFLSLASFFHTAMSTSIASSSRSIFRYTAPKAPQSQARTVIHHARPPRVPVLNSPHTPKTPSPSPGTSTANTSHPVPPQSSYSLENSNLTFHHAPPPSAPSYTTGSVPPLLQWVNGQQVHLTGEEGAPIRKHRRGDGKGPQWDGGVKRQMIEMRSRGMSRGDIAKT